jgi:hypothetical protein
MRYQICPSPRLNLAIVYPNAAGLIALDCCNVEEYCCGSNPTQTAPSRKGRGLAGRPNDVRGKLARYFWS